MDLIRQGIISSVNYDKGMAKVTYPDRDDEVTDNFPILSFGSEYFMPKVGDRVLVAHLSTGVHEGVIIGKYWNGDNVPNVSGQGKYHKELSLSNGDVYVDYDEGTLKIHAKKIILEADEIELDGAVEATKKIKADDFKTDSLTFSKHVHIVLPGITDKPQ